MFGIFYFSSLVTRHLSLVICHSSFVTRHSSFIVPRETCPLTPIP